MVENRVWMDLLGQFFFRRLVPGPIHVPVNVDVPFFQVSELFGWLIDNFAVNLATSLDVKSEFPGFL